MIWDDVKDYWGNKKAAYKDSLIKVDLLIHPNPSSD
jgi:hypothetical protein